MSILEIAKIQVRRGQENQTGVPQLSGGEFAWAADTEHLYIGLKREDGGSRDANVRILTENDLRNFFAVENTVENTSGIYTYRSGTGITVYDNGTEIYTEPVFGPEYTRPLQNKLDEYVSIADFGVLGNNTSQDELWQLAIDRLYASTATEFQSINGSLPPAKVLNIPAGTYSLMSTIYIPKNTHLIGEGIDKTILVFHTQTNRGFQTIDVNEYRNNPNILPHSGLFDPAFNNSMSTPYIPSNVHFENMTIKFEYTSTTTLVGGPLISLDCADNASIKRVKFEGNFNETKTSSLNYAGIELRGYAEEKTTRNVVIEDCEFKNLYAGITSNYDVTNISIQNNFFYKMFHGVAFNKPVNTVAGTTGPRYARLMNNKFLDIMQDGFYVGPTQFNNATNHLSIGNQYINVGNNGQNETYSTGTSIITFLTRGNTSVNDYFDRQNWQDLNGGTYKFNPIITGKAVISRSEASTSTVAVEQSVVLTRLPITGNQQEVIITYSCYENPSSNTTVDRSGTSQFHIKAGLDPEVIISDEYTFTTTDGSLFWSATVDADLKLIEIILHNPTLAFGGTGRDIEVEYQLQIML